VKSRNLTIPGKSWALSTYSNACSSPSAAACISSSVAQPKAISSTRWGTGGRKPGRFAGGLTSVVVAVGAVEEGGGGEDGGLHHSGRSALFLVSGSGRHNLSRNGMAAWACQNLPSLAAEPIPFFEPYLLSWSGYRGKNYTVLL
jgi:hypothetical protein